MEREVTMDWDLSTMPEPLAQRLESLLNESNFFDIPLVTDLRAGPDEHAYSLTVVAGDSFHTVHATDTSMPRSLRPLIDELTQLASATL